MGPPAAPFELELISQRLFHPSAPPQQPGARTHLSCFDVISCATATVRAWGFPGSRIDAAALAAAVQATVDELPFLAGRLSAMPDMSLGSLCIEHCPPGGGGALLTVVSVEASDVSISCMGPSAWPQRGVTLADPATPFYVDGYDSSFRGMGKEPLMKVRLTRFVDGDALAITLCHVITDGMRWPALADHLCSRYRAALAQASGGGSPSAAAAAAVAAEGSKRLLRPSDRRLLSSEQMARQLGADPSGWAAAGPSLRVKASLAGYWRLAKLVLADSRQEQDLLVLHIPQAQVADLKRAAAALNPAVTTGDAVQAAAALLLHAAVGRPLLPVAPLAQAVLIQLPTPPGYFGNAAHMLPVSVPAGSEQPAEGDWAGALCRLAGAIRAAVAAFRAGPEGPLKALRDTEALVAAPAHRMLSYLAAHRMPRLTCTTNYVPTQQALELAPGQLSTYCLGMTMPRARDMAVIRSAVAPYSPGLFLQLSLAPQHAQRLARLPLLGALLPAARLVGRGEAS